MLALPKGRGTKDQISNIHWIIKKAREYQKNIYSCFIDYAKAFDCIDHNKMWKILQQMGIPDHLICLLRNLYAGQEATVRTRHGTAGLVQNWERSTSSCIMPPCLFNLFAEYIMQNARLDEAQAGIKTAARNTSNLRYADDSTLMEGSEEEPKSLLTKVKEGSGEAGLKLDPQETKSTAAGPIASRQIERGKEEAITDFVSWLQNPCRQRLQP